jgi:hypothetical protein
VHNCTTSTGPNGSIMWLIGSILGFVLASQQLVSQHLSSVTRTLSAQMPTVVISKITATQLASDGNEWRIKLLRTYNGKVFYSTDAIYATKAAAEADFPLFKWHHGVPTTRFNDLFDRPLAALTWDTARRFLEASER